MESDILRQHNLAFSHRLPKNLSNPTMSNSKEIHICGILSHIEVKGNEIASDLASDKFKIAYTDFKSKINKFFHTKII